MTAETLDTSTSESRRRRASIPTLIASTSPDMESTT